MTLLKNIHQVIKNLNKADPYHTFADMAEYAGLTNAGMHDSLKNQSIKVRTLEKVCEFYDISLVDMMKMATELDNVDGKSVQEPAPRYQSKEKMQLLEEEVKFKNEQIEHYQQMLQFYKSQINNKNQSS